MTDIRPEIPDDDDLLAAELAFGLLAPGDRAAAERRVSDDAAFAARYRLWQARGVALIEGGAETPPERVWAAIARALPVGGRADEVADDPARPASDPANDNARGWKIATAVAASLALVLGATLLLRPAPPPRIVQVAAPRAHPLVAVLASTGRKDIVAVDYDAAARRLSVTPEALAVDAHDAELWVIPAGGAPVSLGVIGARAPTARVASARAAALLVPGSTLAISLEPRGGSPTGAPTGAVILTGTIARS